MVLLIKGPETLASKSQIEKHFKELTGLKRCLAKFITVEKFLKLSGIEPSRVFMLLANHKKIHAYIFNKGPLMIHPMAIEFARKQMKKRLLAELSGDLSKFGQTKRIPASYRQG